VPAGLLSGLIRSPWTGSFRQLISTAERELLLAAPFVKTQTAETVLSTLEDRGVTKDIRVRVLTNLRPESILSGSIDMGAFSTFSTSLPKFELFHLPGLHAKVYVADEKVAVITSANLTPAGISGNLEYGAAFCDQEIVRQVRADFEEYSALGATIDSAEIDVMLREAEELRQAYAEAERSIRADARQTFEKRLDAARLELWRQRAKGKTTGALFAETIVYLLKRGPLHTAELHPLIQQLHPDLCDDSIDRVIDGVHFGKRWKHHVRSAQSHLKARGVIRNQDGLWYLVRSR
jgi:phosphatidylserine/phosphatidylglycerophosphate/cardiolipin synthase-like enzyme